MVQLFFKSEQKWGMLLKKTPHMGSSRPFVIPQMHHNSSLPIQSHWQTHKCVGSGLYVIKHSGSFSVAKSP